MYPRIMVSCSLPSNTILQSRSRDGLYRNEASKNGIWEHFRAHNPSSRSLWNDGRKALVILVLLFHGELGTVDKGDAGVCHFMEGGLHLGEGAIEVGGRPVKKGCHSNFVG